MNPVKATDKLSHHETGRGLQLGAVRCPGCHAPMPALALPTAVHRLMWGGFTCPGCSARMDKWGDPVSDKAPGQ